MTLQKKTILVTGASRGIGKSIAMLLRADHRLDVYTPRREELDLEVADSIETYCAGIPDLDGLVNVAGINVLGNLESLDLRTIQQMMQTNLLAPLALIQKVVPGMKRKGGGRIVNFSSIWGVRSKERRTLYSMAKFGIEGMTRSLARELGPFGILVNAIAPGFVLTDMTRKNLSPDEQVALCNDIPLRRMAEPEEIAHLVRFLLSDENTYITGQNMVIDGGFLA